MSEETKAAPAVIDRRVDAAASDIIQQRKESQKWMDENYNKEFMEVYRTAKARVEPLMKKMGDGETKEDKTRTNICFPDHFVMIRHGKARLTRNPPNLRMRSSNRSAAEKMAALIMYQWDRSESQLAFSKVVHAAKMLGIGFSKTYYDKRIVTRQFRKLITNLTAKQIAQLNGAPDDELAQMDDKTPPDEATLSAATAEHGDIVTLPTPVTQYEGCVLADVFVGDLFGEPGWRSVHESGYWIENSMRDEDWLKYWTKQVTTDPDSGEEQPIISEEAAAELMELAGDGKNLFERRDQNLRRQMRDSIGLSDPTIYNANISAKSRKRFMIDERHSIQDGKLVIEYVGQENVYLGKQWYPYETYGRYLYSGLVLIPDLLGGIGDATPRISKFLMQMRNNRGNQTNDFINNKLAPMMKGLDSNNYTEEDLQRSSYMRLLKVKAMNELEPLEDPQFPGEAWQEQAAIVREMQQIEPSMNDFAPGTDAIPQSGKLATTAVLAQKSADSIFADELGQVNFFVRDVLEPWVHINQQAMEEDVTISKGDVAHVDMMMIGMEGKPTSITINPMDIQEEMQVLPEAGSTLAADDEYKVKSLQQGLQLAGAFPDVLDSRYFATELVKAMPGVNAEQAIKPPAPPPPPPPPKVNIGLAIKWTDLKPDAQVAILGEMNLPTQDTAILGTIDHAANTMEHVGRAANVADDLQSPANGRGAASPGGDSDDPSLNVRTPKGLAGE